MSFQVLTPVVIPGFSTVTTTLISSLTTTGAIPLATGASGASLWTGHGAPGVIDGSESGDEYLDLDTGNVYTLS